MNGEGGMNQIHLSLLSPEPNRQIAMNPTLGNPACIEIQPEAQTVRSDLCRNSGQGSVQRREMGQITTNQLKQPMRRSLR